MNRVFRMLIALVIVLSSTPIFAATAYAAGGTPPVLESYAGNLVADAALWKADFVDDGKANRSVDLALIHSGNLPSGMDLATPDDIREALPGATSMVVVILSGKQIQSVLDQMAGLESGMLSGAGITWYLYNDGKTHGAYGITINGVPLNREKVYRVAVDSALATMTESRPLMAGRGFDVQAALGEYVATRTSLDRDDVPMQRVVMLDKVITILHTNDTHGYWEAASYSGRTAGMVYLADLIKAERAANPNTLLLDAGDAFQGNAFAFFFKDTVPNPIAGGMNLLQYDAMVPGNHEYNFGSATFATMLGQLNFPILGGANLDDDGRYGFVNDHLQDYITKTVDGVEVAIFGLTNAYVPSYEFPDNIAGLTFSPAITAAKTLVPTILDTDSPDLVIGLTHVGYAPDRTEIGSDIEIAQSVAGIDVLVGGHTHTVVSPSVIISSTLNPTGTLVAQAERYALNLGKVNIGFTYSITDGYQIVMREGYLIPASEGAVDTELETYLQPFSQQIADYKATPIGYTLAPLDAVNAFTEETSGANLQADASVWKLQQGDLDVDFHLSGAMTNQAVASGATATNVITLTRGDMFTLMPYENSLLVMQINGPQLKAILERSYRNYWWFKYSPDGKYGGYPHYTTCMLDINEGGQITYKEMFPAQPDGNNVVSLVVNGHEVDFTDSDTYYNVSTVNYLAAGSCSFNDNGETLWPLSQMVSATQYYVRDAVIDYIDAQSAPISPTVEGRLVFQKVASPNLSTSTKMVVDASGDGKAEAGEILTYTITISNTGDAGASIWLTDTLPAGTTYVSESLSYSGFPGLGVTMEGNVLVARTPSMTETLMLNLPGVIEFAVQVSDPIPSGSEISNQIELTDQFTGYTIAPANIPLSWPYSIYLPLVVRN
ncbi:MAG: 5'-nucleotidase C-terminal domain-containing protein [Anaerolineae bacterium]|nr:5'-nucleotidase C-terminal domain-containing protein [Anaerolineae bacterium]